MCSFVHFSVCVCNIKNLGKATDIMLLLVKSCNFGDKYYSILYIHRNTSSYFNYYHGLNQTKQNPIVIEKKGNVRKSFWFPWSRLFKINILFYFSQVMLMRRTLWAWPQTETTSRAGVRTTACTSTTRVRCCTVCMFMVLKLCLNLYLSLSCTICPTPKQSIMLKGEILWVMLSRNKDFSISFRY